MDLYKWFNANLFLMEWDNGWLLLLLDFPDGYVEARGLVIFIVFVSIFVSLCVSNLVPFLRLDRTSCPLHLISFFFSLLLN